MTLQAISKGFEYYKKYGLNFTIKILPLIFLFGFLASVGSSSSLSDGISNFDIFWLLINNFLISPLLTIIAIFIANDLIENNKRREGPVINFSNHERLNEHINFDKVGANKINDYFWRSEIRPIQFKKSQKGTVQEKYLKSIEIEASYRPNFWKKHIEKMEVTNA